MCSNYPQTHNEDLKKTLFKKKDYISQTARVTTSRQQQQQRIPPPPSSNRAADVSKGLPRHTHPLINNTTFNIPASPRTPNPSFPGHTGGNVSLTSQINPLLHHSARQHLRAPGRLFVSSAIITMRQAAWQRCGMKRRSGGDSTARTRRTGTPLKLSPRRVWAILSSSCAFSP